MTLILELILCTAGSLLYLFLLTLFAGLRRRKAFEVTLFLTGIAIFCFFSGQLLELNARFQYGEAPPSTALSAGVLTALGFILLPALVVHTHVEYLRRLENGKQRNLLYLLVVLSYFGSFLGVFVGAFTTPWMNTLPAYRVLDVWMLLAFGFSAVLEMIFAKRASISSTRMLHWALGAALLGLGILTLVSAFSFSGMQAVLLVPGVLFGYFVLRNRALFLGIQRNLVLSVTVTFIALLYLTLARRVSDLLEPYFPPVATTSVMLFTLVVFFEPLQRRVSKVLQRAFRAEAEQLQRLTAEIQHVARAGNLPALITFAETRIRESFSLSGVIISLAGGPGRPAEVSGNVQRFILRNGPAEIGVLEAYFFGQSLSGETHAALDYLVEQLPAAIDLCRLLDEKLRLERELAERERLALLGQMAASVSHNLRNPLSSIKTLLQLQLENPGLPASARPDCEKAIAEVDRLNAKLTQLLRYAKPAVRAGSGIAAARVDVAAVAAQTVSLLHHEAERRGVSLTLEGAAEKLESAATEEAVSDVLSNLIVNAIEAVPTGGSVRVRLSRRDASVVLEVIDDGPGIPEYVRPRIFQPFFTTKPSGTGLGLAIVEKRLAEIGATIDCESPAPASSRGTRFIVTLAGVD
jgi:signal transduction histidine kinase